MRLSIKHIVFSILILPCWSCQEQSFEPNIERLGSEYYPLEIGQFREYEVDEISYVFNGNHDTIHFFLREVVADTFLSFSGELTYELRRYTKLNETDEWGIDSVWSAYKNERGVVVNESNIPYLKLAFPIQDQLQWDANSFNGLDEQTYAIDSIFFPFSAADTTFLNSLTVGQEKESTELANKLQYEIFTEGVGLLYKQFTDIRYCSDIECFGQFIIETGRDYRQLLIAYGKEE